MLFLTVSRNDDVITLFSETPPLVSRNRFVKNPMVARASEEKLLVIQYLTTCTEYLTIPLLNINAPFLANFFLTVTRIFYGGGG